MRQAKLGFSQTARALRRMMLAAVRKPVSLLRVAVVVDRLEDV
ncbi:MAG: hypothetical protein ACTFAK_00610 [Candidatus Electronema sp. VV]